MIEDVEDLGIREPKVQRRDADSELACREVDLEVLVRVLREHREAISLTDPANPKGVAEAIHALGLRHAVITSVNRDELQDGGASVFAETIRQARHLNPTCTIEVLIPDFEGNEEALKMICAEKPEIVNHNIETDKVRIHLG